MTKADVVAKVATQLLLENPGIDLNTQDITTIIDAFCRTVRVTVTNGRKVTIRNFGSFAPKYVKAKPARDITRGLSMLMPATMRVSFKPADSFKKQVKERLSV